MANGKNERFRRTYRQSNLGGSLEIWVDVKTGVNYLYRSSGYSGGLAPLLDAEGKPVVTPVRSHNGLGWME